MRPKTRRIVLAAAVLGLAQPLAGHGAPVHAEPDRRIDAVVGVVTRAPVIALTFDDGPHPVWTPRILDILRRERVPATFFVLGPWARRFPGLVGAEAAQGHEVDCHGWDHHFQVSRPRAELVETYRRCATEVASLTGRRPRVIRPPYGVLEPAQFDELAKARFVTVLWDVNALPLGSKPGIRLPIDERQVRRGAIVLLHDGRRDRRDVVALLPRLIDALRAHGYRFVTVSDLLRRGPAVRESARLLHARFCSYRHGIFCGMPGISPAPR